MTKTHKIYMTFDLKRTKKLTLTFILINTTILFFVINSHGIVIDNVEIKSRLKGFYAKHELKSKLNSSAWLPKFSFIVLQLDTNSSRIPTQINWESSSQGLSGFTLGKSWMHYKPDVKQILIPYIILPGKRLNLVVNYEEVADSNLQLPQLSLEEGEQKHLQRYQVEIDTRYTNIKLVTKTRSQLIQNTPSSPKLKIEVTTGLPAPTLLWKYTQTLNTVEFMG
tara:strand:+ start:856 stop:1524 length:669 start_codon:yes stop_codon:yes gene_type:complete